MTRNKMKKLLRDVDWFLDKYCPNNAYACENCQLELLCGDDVQPCMWKDILEKEISKKDKLFASRISKGIKVSDPVNWYDKNKIKVSMWNNRFSINKDTVRIMFFSIGDFLMYKDFDKGDLETNWNRCYENYVKLPKTISVRWLLDHGYEFY